MKKYGAFSYRVKLILIWCVVILLITGLVSLALTYSATRQMLKDQKAHLELLTEQVLINLIENAYKYGFILRYPEGKEHITGYMYEPWHYRYIGVENAAKIYSSGLTLEEYFGLTSVYSE